MALTATRLRHKMANQAPQLAILGRSLDELRKAPLLDKAARAETVIRQTLNVLCELERRVTALELAHNSPTEGAPDHAA